MNEPAMEGRAPASPGIIRRRRGLDPPTPMALNLDSLSLALKLN